MDNYAKHNKNMRALIRYEDVPTKIWLITDMTDFWGINVRTGVRLNFLLKHSLSLSDFLQKAKLLHVEVDVSGKYTTYRLTDFEQKRPIRDSSLISKEDKKRMDAHPEKRIFSKEEIERRCEKNVQNHSIVFGQSEIFKEYQKQQKWFKENLGIRLVVEPWQIELKTPDAIRVFCGGRAS
jgi:nucleotidyltransferase/DNA polymerase involved in DNA repair